MWNVGDSSILLLDWSIFACLHGLLPSLVGMEVMRQESQHRLCGPFEATGAVRALG